MMNSETVTTIAETLFEFDVDYDPKEVSEILKSQEALILNQRILKLEQELRDTVKALKCSIAQLGLNNGGNYKRPLGTVLGTDIKFVPVGKGLRVYGKDTRANKELLKELGGTWNSTLVGWIYPMSKKLDLIKAGIVEEHVV